MALINCPECKEEISSDTRVCPKCGFKQFNMTTWWGTALAGILIFIGLSSFLVKYMEPSLSYFIAFITSIALGFYGYNKRSKPD